MAGYIINYQAEGDQDSPIKNGRVDIFANATQHTLSDLQGGLWYTITMVAKSRSTVAGPVRVTLGNFTNHTVISHQYAHDDELHCLLRKVVGISGLHICICANFISDLNLFYPAVVRVKVVNATALLVSWDALKNSHHYTIYYSAFSPELFKVVDESTTVVPSTRMSDIVVIRELTAGVEHQFQVTASLEVQGEVYKSGKSIPTKIVIGKIDHNYYDHLNFLTKVK